MIPYHYICIEGNIGAGKTTLARKLSEKLESRLILEEFEENPFLPLFYEDPDRYALQTELTFLTDRYKQLSSELINRSLFQPVTVADYYLYKSRLFARNNLSEHDFRLYERIFHIVESSLPRPDLMLFLMSEPEALLRNIAGRGRPYESSIEIDYLKQLQDAYMTYLSQEIRFPILLIPMQKLDFLNNPEDLQTVEASLHKKYPPGLHRIDAGKHGFF